MKKGGVISDKEYKKILNSMPIPCVDLVIAYKGKFLLGKRINEPARGQWFFVGGRILKGETITNAVIRKAKEELGIKIHSGDISYLGLGETIFKGKGIEANRHSVNIACLLRLKSLPAISFDKKQSSEINWFSAVDKKWDPYVKEMLKKAGF